MLPQTVKPKPVYDTGTAAAITLFSGQRDKIIKRGTAYKHTSGDVYVIICLIWKRPTGIKPMLEAVILERSRDEKQFERSVKVIEEELDKETLRYAEGYNDERENVSIDMDDERLYMWTQD